MSNPIRRRHAAAPPTSGGADALAADPADAPDPRVTAERLAARGDLVGAIEVLAAADRRVPDDEVRLRLVELRLAAAAALADGTGRTPWPPTYADPFPGVAGRIPEVAREGFTTAVAGGAVAHHGALLVRDLFSAEQVDRVRSVIDRADEVRDDVCEGRTPPSAAFSPVSAEPRLDNHILRRMVARQGGTWLADSPAGTAVVLDALHEVGAVAMMAEHFGEPPVFSLQKSTLRRSAPEDRLVAWHQDGSFLDPSVRTMNIWVALTACGGEMRTPALEVVPRRMEDILPVDGVLSPHAVDESLVAEVMADTPSVVPVFGPGDALVFDEHLLHRTHLVPDMTDPRYALECWFFAPSHRTETYLPLLA